MLLPNQRIYTGTSLIRVGLRLKIVDKWKKYKMVKKVVEGFVFLFKQEQKKLFLWNILVTPTNSYTSNQLKNNSWNSLLGTSQF